MKVICPSCRQIVPATDVFLARAWAKCTHCREVFQVPELLNSAAASSNDHIATLERPFDAKIEILRTDSQLLVSVPAYGLKAEAWVVLLFGIFWTGFIAFWTYGALGGFEGFKSNLNWERAIFASFSIPFWLVGIFILRAAFLMVFSTSQVVIDPIKAVFVWAWPGGRQVTTVDRDKVQIARNPDPVPRLDEPRQQGCTVEVVYLRGSFKICCETAYEQRWVIETINKYLREVPPLTGS